jgi:hypothetical protein
MAVQDVKTDRVLAPVEYTITEEYYDGEPSWFNVVFTRDQIRDGFYNDGFNTAAEAEAWVFETFGVTP